MVGMSAVSLALKPFLPQTPISGQESNGNAQQDGNTPVDQPEATSTPYPDSADSQNGYLGVESGVIGGLCGVLLALGIGTGIAIARRKK